MKKVWRDAASLILVTGPFKYSRPPLAKSLVRPARATPVVLEEDGTGVGGGGEGDCEEDMRLLFVKRNSKSGFMPNNYVFPGGVIDQADSSPNWLDLFNKSVPVHMNPFSSILGLNRPDLARPSLYGDQTVAAAIPGDIAFRICAIRETFEEAGVLLARDQSEVAQVLDFLPGSFRPAFKELTEKTLENWRERVHRNAEEFITMCRELHCVPDIWSLVEWSNWLTPRNLGRRYDTIFYLVCSQEQLPVKEDGKEVIHAQWMSPHISVQRFLTGEIILAPPQFAEMHYIQLFMTAPCLHSYALHKSLHDGVGRMTATRIRSKDDVIMSIMEDDDLYPEEETMALYPVSESMGKFVHPRGVKMRDVILEVSSHKLYEFHCTTHTANELTELSDKRSRMELRGLNNISFLDNLRTPEILQHLERYRLACETNKNLIPRNKL